MSMSMQTTSEAVEDELGRSGVRVYRGRKISDVLPTIRAELGADAVILRHREGVGGGVGGFFAQRFVEVEAMPGSPRVDMYDDGAPDGLEDLFRVPAASEQSAASEEPTLGEALATHMAEQAADPDPTPAVGAQAFLARLAAAANDVPTMETAPPPPVYTPVAPPEAMVPPARPRVNGAAGLYAEVAAASSAPIAEPVPAPAPVAAAAPVPASVSMAAPPPPLPAREPHIQSTDREAATVIAEELISRGMGSEQADDLILEAASHALPFVPSGDLREAVRRTLARRLSGLTTPPSRGSVVAFIGAGGSGKTRCAAGLAAAYQGVSSLETSCLSLTPEDGGSELNGLLRAHGIAVRAAEPGAGGAWVASVRDAGLVIIDTPAVRVKDEESIAALAQELAALEPDHILVTLPATLSSAAAGQLLTRIAPMKPTGIVVTHADETDQIGVAIDLAWQHGLQLAYLHDGVALPGSLLPADPQDLAGRLLP